MMPRPLRRLWPRFVLWASGPWRKRFVRCRWCRFAQPRYLVRTANLSLPRLRCGRCRRHLVP
jgi:hypothetical protein